MTVGEGGGLGFLLGGTVMRKRLEKEAGSTKKGEGVERNVEVEIHGAKERVKHSVYIASYTRLPNLS